MIEHSKEVSQELSKLLAESYTLYLKTHNYHWNVTGPMFHSLHLLFEQQYTELATAVDTIAERLRPSVFREGRRGRAGRHGNAEDADRGPSHRGGARQQGAQAGRRP